ncbi:GNAT family N-acyltransferase [Massilia sp. W12]|uniref:GNAT family N-acetyltransferase n=1 Tax=Massilia sp. W12 TaxID=3126507 RepID=UPI0030CF4FAE
MQVFDTRGLSSKQENKNTPRLSLSLAQDAGEVREAQSLRYRSFVQEMGLVNLQNPEGLDADEFDPWCDHLLVRDNQTLEVVGAYRLLSPARARQFGRMYSENEFDISRLSHLKPRMVEAGRACIHPDYRGGSVLMLLWQGMSEYMRRQQAEFLVGCASISLADGGMNAAAVYRSLQAQNMAPPEYRVKPHLPFPHEHLHPNAQHKVHVPPLLKGYLRAQTWVCGEPAWDPDFDCADLLMLLPLRNLDARYARHFGAL